MKDSRKKLGRGLRDISEIFKTGNNPGNGKSNPSSRRRTQRIIITNPIQSGSKIPLLLITKLKKNNYRSFFIHGTLDHYSLIGAGNANVPYHFIIKEGKPLFAVHGDNILLDDVTSQSNFGYDELLEILMLNIQLTLKHLDAIFFVPDELLDYRVDFLLCIIPLDSIDEFEKQITVFDYFSSDIPAGILVMTEKEIEIAKESFEEKLESLEQIQRDIRFLGIVDERNSTIDIDISLMFMSGNTSASAANNL